MKFNALLFFVFFAAVNCSAQSAQSTPPKLIQQPAAEPCNAKPENLPVVRGLRLEMPKLQVQKEYPRMKITADPVKSSGVVFGYQIENPDYGNNIDRITVMFRNEKVFSILFNYTNAVSWDSAQEFADKISASLKLPKAREKKNAGGTFYSVICNNFMVRTRINGDKQPILLITLDPDEIWETTQEKKAAFKP